MGQEVEPLITDKNAPTVVSPAPYAPAPYGAPSPYGAPPPGPYGVPLRRMEPLLLATPPPTRPLTSTTITDLLPSVSRSTSVPLEWSDSFSSPLPPALPSPLTFS